MTGKEDVAHIQTQYANMNLILCEAPVRFVATKWSIADVIKASFLALRVGTVMSFSNNAQLHCMISHFRSQARNAYMIGKTLRGMTVRRGCRKIVTVPVYQSELF